MARIYVVQGNTGSYSDYCVWPVIAFREKEKAEEYVKALYQRIEEIILTSKCKDPYDDRDRFDEKIRELDPRLINMGETIEYKVLSIPLEMLEEVKEKDE